MPWGDIPHCAGLPENGTLDSLRHPTDCRMAECDQPITTVAAITALAQVHFQRLPSKSAPPLPSFQLQTIGFGILILDTSMIEKEVHNRPLDEFVQVSLCTTSEVSQPEGDRRRD